MRLKSTHIIMLALALLAGFFIYVLVLRDDAPQGDDDFLETVRQRQQTRDQGELAGSVPPIDADPSLVPVIELETHELDLGLVPNNELTQRKFAIHNRGKAPLRIHNIQTSCACTEGVIPPERRTILPGESGEMDIVFNPYRVAGFTSSRILTLSSNDPVNATVQIVVDATIEPEFLVEPESFDFPQVLVGSTETQTVRIRQVAPMDEPWTVNVVDVQAPGGTPVPWLNARFEQVPESEWREPSMVEYDISATITEDAPRGAFDVGVFVFSSLRRVPQYRIPLTTEIVSPVALDPAYPQRLVLRENDEGRVAGLAVIRSLDGATFTIEGADYNENRLEVSLPLGQAITEAQIPIQVRPDAAGEAIEETIEMSVTTASGAFTERIVVRAPRTTMPEPSAPEAP